MDRWTDRRTDWRTDGGTNKCCNRLSGFLLFNFITGFDFKTPSGLEARSRAMVTLSLDDLPARSLLSNMKHFNGERGCSMCDQSGETVSKKIIETLRSSFLGISHEPRTSRSHMTSALPSG